MRHVDGFGLKNLYRVLLFSLAASLVTTPIVAQEDVNIATLDQFISAEWQLEDLAALLKDHQFQPYTLTVQNGETFNDQGFRTSALTWLHPDLPEDFIADCYDQECSLLRATRRVPAFIRRWDHEYSYIWLFRNQKMHSVYVDHGRWIFRK